MLFYLEFYIDYKMSNYKKVSQFIKIENYNKKNKFYKQLPKYAKKKTLQKLNILTTKTELFYKILYFILNPAYIKLSLNNNIENFELLNNFRKVNNYNILIKQCKFIFYANYKTINRKKTSIYKIQRNIWRISTCRKKIYLPNTYKLSEKCYKERVYQRYEFRNLKNENKKYDDYRE